MSLAQQDFEIFKNALVYTVAVQAVNRIVDHRDGSVLTMVITAALMTYGAQVLKDTLQAAPVSHPMVAPMARAGVFVAGPLVAVGINMQSTLIGTYFGTLFNNGIHPFFVLGSSVVGLVLLWVLGIVAGAV